MLKKFLLLTVLMFFSLNAYPHGIEWFMPVVLFKDARWTPIQISFWPVHLCSSGTGVYGLAVSPGLLSWYEKVYGISCGQIVFIGENNGLDVNIYSCGFQNNGLAVGVFNEWTKNNGVSLGLVNFIRNRNGNIEERTFLIYTCQLCDRGQIA